MEDRTQHSVRCEKNFTDLSMLYTSNLKAPRNDDHSDQKQFNNIDSLIVHTLSCLSTLAWAMNNENNHYNIKQASLFWSSVSTIGQDCYENLQRPSEKYNENYVSPISYLLQEFPVDPNPVTDTVMCWLPLHWAAVSSEKNHLAIVQDLCKGDPVKLVSRSTNEALLPVHYLAAGRNPNFELLDFFSRLQPMFAGAKTAIDSLPLHFAAEFSNDVRMVEQLLQSNPTVAASTTKLGWTPLHYAVKNNSSDIERYKIVKCLIETEPSALTIATSPDLHLPLHHAITSHYCDENVVRILLDAAPQAVQAFDEKGFLPLSLFLISLRVFINRRPSVYDVAAEKVVKLLIEAYPEAIAIRAQSFDNRLPLEIAAEIGSIPIFDIVLKASSALLFGEEGNKIIDLVHTVAVRGPVGTSMLTRLNECFPGVGSRGLRSPTSNNLQNLLQLAMTRHISSSTAETPNLRMIRECIRLFPDTVSLPNFVGDLALHIFVWAVWQYIPKSDEEEAFSIFRMLLSIHPQGAHCKTHGDRTPFMMFNKYNSHKPLPKINDDVRRLLLNINPADDPELCRNLNFRDRRNAMFLGYAAIPLAVATTGRQTIFFELRHANMSLFKLVVGFL